MENLINCDEWRSEKMENVDMSFDELYGLGDVDAFLNKAKEKCETKLRGKSFAGMDTEDVVQEVLIKIHKSFDKYDHNKAKVSTYVDHVMENMIKDCYKKCGTEKNLFVVNAVELDYSSNWESEESDRRTQGVQVGAEDTGYQNVDFMYDLVNNLGLTPRESEIFHLRSQGYEFVEIANFLGVSKARISQIWRGIKEKYDSL